MNRLVPALILALVVIVATANAQFDVDGPNAAFTINGNTPSAIDSIDHDVEVLVPGTLELAVTSGANPNQRLMLLASPVDPTTGNTFATPWGGSLDLGTPGLQGITILGDGINFSTGLLDGFFVTDAGNPVTGAPPTWNLNATATAGLAGARVAFQVIIQDPTNGPFLLDNTEAGDANFVAGQRMIVTPIGPQVSVEVPFLSGKVFNFHGVGYTSVFVNNKGYVNFLTPTSVGNGGFDLDAQSWVLAEPSIAPWISDWENLSAPEGILYEEAGSTARIAWGNPEGVPGGLGHFGANATMNEFEVTLQLNDPTSPNPNDGRFTIDILRTDPSTTDLNGDGILGHTPGGSVLQARGDVGLHDVSQVSGARDAQVEEHNATGMNASILGADGNGVTPRAYNNFHSWNQTSVTFTPNPQIAAPGDQGYTSQSTMFAPDDVVGTAPQAIPVSGGSVTVVGKFWGFNDAAGAGGSVVFDPSGLNLAAFVVGIRDNSGTVVPAATHTPGMSPFRDGEALDIVVPPFPATGTYDMQVTFNSGAVFTIPVNVVQNGVVVTQYSLGNGGTSPSHNLTNTIDFYGTTYTNLFIQSHGYITLGAVTGNDFSESLPEFFNGFVAPGAPGVPGVAAFWSDLNRNNPNAVFEVVEDTTSNETTINFLNQNHWDTFGPAGDVSVTFGLAGPGSVTWDLSQFIPDGGSTHDVIIGVTDGDDQVGPNTDLTVGTGTGTGISSVIGTYLSTSAPDAIGELIAPGVMPGSVMFNFVDTGDGMSTPFGTWAIF